MKLDDFPDKVLSPEEENEIAISPQSGEGRERLILHNMREALLYAKKCSYGRLGDGDLVSACYLGLRAAAKNFSPNKIRFFGYAKPYIRGMICAEFREMRVVKKSEMTAWEPTTDTIKDDGTDSSEDEGYSRRTKENSDWRPLVPESEDFNFGLTQFREEWRLIEPMVKQILSDKERMILELRYISGYNFRQIGDLLAIPVSRSHVQHIHGVALGKIRSEMAKHKLEPHCSEE